MRRKFGLTVASLCTSMTLVVITGFLAALLVPSAAQAATPASTAQRADTKNCDFWFDSDDEWGNWYAAQNEYTRNRTDPHKLDGDKDGYACEWLARYTQVKDEPSCKAVKKTAGIQKQCRSRDAYRSMFILTYYASPYVLRAGATSLFSPYAKKGEPNAPNVQQMYTDLMNWIPSARNPACIRDGLLRWIKVQDAADAMTGNFVDLIQAGTTALSASGGVKSFTKDYIVSKFIPDYFSVATDAAKSGVKWEMSSQVVNHMAGMQSC